MPSTELAPSAGREETSVRKLVDPLAAFDGSPEAFLQRRDTGERSAEVDLVGLRHGDGRPAIRLWWRRLLAAPEDLPKRVRGDIDR